MHNLPFAEDTSCWRSSKSSPDIWTERARQLIDKAGGRLLYESWLSDLKNQRYAYVLVFEFDGDIYRINWPVLPTRSGDVLAAKRQAATLVHHHVKDQLLTAKILGIRTAFAGHLRLEDGHTVGETLTPELARLLPALPAPSAPIVEIVEE